MRTGLAIRLRRENFSSFSTALLPSSVTVGFPVTFPYLVSMKSVLTQSALDALSEKFHILDTVHPELPGPNDRIRNSPTGKIGVYSRFFDFANYRIPLYQFHVDILEYFRINLFQLPVIAAAKVSDFEILYRVHGFVPTI
nr:transposase (putative), gypsy type [Tanacetum cinerariifolium]